jgi:hypothetical protein
MSLVPQLLRLCSAQGASWVRSPLLSLYSFNPSLSSPAVPVSQRRWYARKSSSSSVKARSRRNIFLDPQKAPESSYAVGRPAMALGFTSSLLWTPYLPGATWP